MKRFSFFLLLVPLFAAVACLSDAEAPSNDPAVPEVRYDSETLTRVSLTIAGTFPDDALSMDYGFELAENSFAGGPDQVFAQPGKDAEGHVTCVADIRPGAVYVVRSYFSNGQYRKSSQPLTITAPLTSAATLTEVTNANGRLSASIRDDVAFVLFLVAHKPMFQRPFAGARGIFHDGPIRLVNLALGKHLVQASERL